MHFEIFPWYSRHSGSCFLHYGLSHCCFEMLDNGQRNLGCCWLRLVFNSLDCWCPWCGTGEMASFEPRSHLARNLEYTRLTFLKYCQRNAFSVFTPMLPRSDCPKNSQVSQMVFVSPVRLPLNETVLLGSFYVWASDSIPHKVCLIFCSWAVQASYQQHYSSDWPHIQPMKAIHQ